MIQIALTPEQQRQLDESHEPVEIVDQYGRVITRLQNGWTDAEVADALLRVQEFGTAGTLDELVARLEREFPESLSSGN